MTKCISNYMEIKWKFRSAIHSITEYSHWEEDHGELSVQTRNSDRTESRRRRMCPKEVASTRRQRANVKRSCGAFSHWRSLLTIEPRRAQYSTYVRYATRMLSRGRRAIRVVVAAPCSRKTGEGASVVAGMATVWHCAAPSAGNGTF